MLLGINMQTAFMHPPFGFSLFYLRSVAAREPYLDRVTGETIAPITTGQIYWGAAPFVMIQVIMIGLTIAFPGMVTRYKAGEVHIAVADQDRGAELWRGRRTQFRRRPMATQQWPELRRLGAPAAAPPPRTSALPQPSGAPTGARTSDRRLPPANRSSAPAKKTAPAAPGPLHRR